MLKSVISHSVNQSTIKLNATRVLLTSKQDVISSQINQQSVRHARNIKPYNRGPVELWKNLIYDYSYRRARGRKILKIKLPDFEETRDADTRMTPDEMRTHLKKEGIVPARKWIERPVYMGDTGRILDEYVPPEGDGKASFISKEGVSQKAGVVTSRGKEMWASRKIRNYIPTFDPQDFALNEALEIYIKAHQALADQDMDALHNLVTETCLPKMLFSSDLKTIKWKFIKSIEIPRCCNVKAEEQDGLCFGQVTVRFHSQQMLAVYDRFGRLAHGSEAILKDVLDYVVFESRVSSTDSVWRIHGK